MDSKMLLKEQTINAVCTNKSVHFRKIEVKITDDGREEPAETL